jgi:hypothetical protein
VGGSGGGSVGTPSAGGSASEVDPGASDPSLGSGDDVESTSSCACRVGKERFGTSGVSFALLLIALAFRRRGQR